MNYFTKNLIFFVFLSMFLFIACGDNNRRGLFGGDEDVTVDEVANIDAADTAGEDISNNDGFIEEDGDTAVTDHYINKDSENSDADDIPVTCGNGEVDKGELCDGNIIECVALDSSKYADGLAYCLDDCGGYDVAKCKEIVSDGDAGDSDTASVENDEDQIDDEAVTDADTAVDDVEADVIEDNMPDPDTAEADVITDNISDSDTADADAIPDADSLCGSVRLDGSTGYIEVAHTESLNLSGNWTIEAWVNQDTDIAPSPIIRKGGTMTYPAYYIYGSYNQSEPYGGYYVDATGGYYAATASRIPNNGKWYHIALVKSGTTLTTYVNGNVGTVVTVDEDSYANGDSLYIGSNRSGAPSYFDGLIDEIRISKVARYTWSFIPYWRFAGDTNTVGLWHFEEHSGSTAADSSGNGLTGALIGGVTWEDNCVNKGGDTDTMSDSDTTTDADVQ